MQQQVMGLVNPLIALVFAGSFLLLWLRGGRQRHVLALCLAYVMLGTGFLVFHFAPNPGARLPMMAMHGAYLVGCALIVRGAAMRVGQSVPQKAILVVAVVGSALILLSTYGNDYDARLYLFNTSYALIFLFGAYALASAGRSAIADRVVTWMFVAASAQFFVRPAVSMIIKGEMSAVAYRDSVYYSIVIVVVAIFSLLIALSLLAACAYDIVQADRTRAERDHLTGLLTRRAFEQEALKMVGRSRVGNVPISLIVADLDHFKQVNDLWGHQTGDNAIKTFGRVIDAAIRTSDLAARIGGEEFCILVWNCEGEPARKLAERIRGALTRTTIEGVPEMTHLTASLGVAGQHPGEGYGHLFARADKAMYAAKHSGRNRVCYDGEARKLSREAAPSNPFTGTADHVDAA